MTRTGRDGPGGCRAARRVVGCGEGEAESMKHFVLSGVMVWMVACGAGGGVPPEEAAAARSELEATWQAEYDAMAAAVPLSADEASKLEQAFESFHADLAAWLDGPEGQRLMALEAEMKAAARGKDLAGVRAATGEARPLRDTFEQKIKAGQQALLDALTPENRARWKGHKLAAHLLELMEPLELSPQQRSAIESNAAAALAQAEARGEANPPAAAFLELERWAETQVLSPDQRSAYEGIKKGAPLRSLRI